jgi:galactokinase
MSSSSAITCGFIACLNQANHWNLSETEMVDLAYNAENRTGLGGGIMDQYSIITSKKGNLLRINCKDLTHEFIPFSLEEETFLVINSKVSHSLVDSAYKDRKQDCLDILKGIQSQYPKVETVSEINTEMLLGFKIDQTKLKRVMHVISENQRVLDVSNALKNNQISKIGPLLSQSHESLSKQYEVSCPEIDFIIKQATSLDGFLGGRIMGGGFGGCCICLIKKDKQASIEKQLFDSYLKTYNLELSFYPVEIVSGVFHSE